MFSRERAEGARPTPRAAHVVVACALALVVGAAFIVPVETRVVASRTELPADGRAIAVVDVVARSVIRTRVPFSRSRPVVDPTTLAALGASTVVDHTGALVVRAGTRAGVVEVRDPSSSAFVSLRFVDDARDLDEDGLPDVSELLGEDDRRAFTSWFTAIAEAQARAIDDDWPPVHQDCAGLVRYAVKEALKTHDAAWRARRRSRVLTAAPDVGPFRYPALPFIGDRIWRVTRARFAPSDDLDAQLSASASARTIRDHNSELVSRDVSAARAGDLLFFAVPDDAGSRMHTMIALGDAPGSASDAPARRVVYHTGRVGDGGVVKLVTLDALRAHPDHAWRPVVDNPRFLGVYRLHLVTHEASRFTLAHFGGQR